MCLGLTHALSSKCGQSEWAIASGTKIPPERESGMIFPAAFGSWREID
jgi:hypothetical protein